MAKYNLTRLLETAKFLGTEAGEQLKAFIEYSAEFVENVSRCLLNGLTFKDNFDCEIKNVSVKDNVATVIGAKKPVTGMIPIRAVSTNSITAFGWWYDSQGQLTVKVRFTEAPTDSQKVTLVLLF